MKHALFVIFLFTFIGMSYAQSTPELSPTVESLKSLENKTSKKLLLNTQLLIQRVQILEYHLSSSPPVISILGQPNSGKTTLARKLAGINDEAAYPFTSNDPENTRSAQFLIPDQLEIDAFTTTLENLFTSIYKNPQKQINGDRALLASMYTTAASDHEFVIADWPSNNFTLDHIKADYENIQLYLSDAFIIVVPSNYYEPSFINQLRYLSLSGKKICLNFNERNGFSEDANLQKISKAITAQAKISALDYCYNDQCNRFLDKFTPEAVKKQRAKEFLKLSQELQELYNFIESLRVEVNELPQAKELDLSEDNSEKLDIIDISQENTEVLSQEEILKRWKGGGLATQIIFKNAIDNFPRFNQIPQQPIVKEISHIWNKDHSSKMGIGIGPFKLSIGLLKSHRKSILYAVKRSIFRKSFTRREAMSFEKLQEHKLNSKSSGTIYAQELQIFELALNALYQSINTAKNDPQLSPQVRATLVKLSEFETILKVDRKFRSDLLAAHQSNAVVKKQLRKRITANLNYLKTHNEAAYKALQNRDVYSEIMKLAPPSVFVGAMTLRGLPWITRYLTTYGTVGTLVSGPLSGFLLVTGAFQAYQLGHAAIDQMMMKPMLNSLAGDVIAGYQFDRWLWFVNWIDKNYLKPLNKALGHETDIFGGYNSAELLLPEACQEYFSAR